MRYSDDVALDDILTFIEAATQSLFTCTEPYFVFLCTVFCLGRISFLRPCYLPSRE